MIITSKNIRVLSLGILCFEGFGIRIFENVISGAIILWTVVLFILNLKNVLRMPINALFKLIGIMLFYVFFCSLKGIKTEPFLFATWSSAFIIISNYWHRQNSFVDDMSSLCRFCMYYSLLHIPIMLLLKPLLITTNFGMNPKTFLYLFYFNSGEGFMGLPRIQGFCWEPSCWNLLLNLNLVFMLYFKRPVKDLILSIVAIVSIMATTGLVVMIVIICVYYALLLERKKFIKNLLVGVTVIAVCTPFVYSELQDKLSTGSGNARVGDFAIAAAVMQNSPILGDDLGHIANNPIAIKARSEAWTSEGDWIGYMDQGMVNSFASLLVEWGAVISIIIIILLLRCPLLHDIKLRILFMIALLGVMIGTPILQTGFFYMFVFSTIILNKKNIKRNESYINNHSDI